MPTALGPRFVLEAGFLVLLALVVGLADVDPLLIVLVMLVGWILVSLIEYFAWRQSRSMLMRGFEPALAGVAVSQMAVDDPPPPPPTTPPPSAPAQPPDEDTAVEPPAVEEEQQEEAREEAEAEEPLASAAEDPAPTAAGEEQIADAAAEERRVEHRLEPLKPRPRRKWIFFGPYVRRDKPAEDDNEA